VTRHGKRPDPVVPPPNEWEISSPGFNGQKRQQYKRYRHWHDGAEIWLGQSLVNGAQGPAERR